MLKKFYTLAISPLFLLFFFFSSRAQLPSVIEQSPQYVCNSTGSAVGGQCTAACVGDVVSYSTTLSGDTYQWFIPPEGQIIGPSDSSIVYVSWNTPGTYLIKVKVCMDLEMNPVMGFAQCDSVLTVICVLPGAVAGISTAYELNNGCIEVCKNTSITFNNDSYANITSSYWNFGDGNTTTTAGAIPVTHTYTTPGTYTVTLIAFRDCCVDTATYCVIVDSLSGPDIYCISPVCGGQTDVTYCTNNTCTSYNWSIVPASAGTITSGNGTSCITVSWGAGPDATLSLLCTAPDVCPKPTLVDVPIMPVGGFSISGPTTVCIGSSQAFSAPYVPGSQYTWTLFDPCTFTTTTLAYNSPPYIQNINFNCAGTYILTCSMVNDVLSCTGSATLVINAIPDFSISGPDTLCVGDMGTFLSTQNFMPFLCDWTTSPSVGSASGTSSASFVFSTPGTYTITAQPSISGSACTPSKSLTVVVLDAPNQPNIAGPTLVCTGTTYGYSVSNVQAGVTYSWTTTGALSLSSSLGANVNVTVLPMFTGGTLTVTPTNEFGCAGPSQTITLNPYAAPTPVIISGSTTACPDDQLPYVATLSYSGVSAVSWAISAPTLGTIIAGSGTSSVTVEWHASIPNVAQTATLTITETICGSLSGSNSYSVTIHPTPSPSAPDVNICIGATAIATVSGGMGSVFNWYTSGSAFVGSGSSIALTSPGNYYVEEIDLNGCRAKDYMQVNAFPQPIVGVYPSGPGNCDNTNTFNPYIQLSTFAGTGYTYSWSASGGGTIVGSSTSNPITIATPGTYTVVVTEPVNGCTKSQSISIGCASGGGGGGGGGCTDPACTCTVGTPTATPVGPYCDNYTLTASGTTCPNINWSFGDGTYGSGSPVNHSYNSPGIYTVYYSAGDAGCCPNLSSTITITVPAVADFTRVVTCNTVCFFDASASLPSDTIVAYSWNFGDGNNSSLENPCHTYATPGTYSVTLEVTTQSGCKATITKLVTALGPQVSASVQPTACNQPVNFNGSVISGNVVNWSWNFGNSQGSNAQNAQHTYSVLTTTTYNITLVATDGNGCTDTATAAITVHPAPAPISLTYMSPGCDSVVIDAGPGYMSYQWYLNGSPISGATNQIYVAYQSGNYSCNVTDANLCLIPSNDASVVVNLSPVFNLHVTPQPICSDKNILIKSGITGGGFLIVQWYDAMFMPLGIGMSYLAGTLAPGPHTYHATATDMMTGCSSSGSITFTVNPAPSVSIVNSNPTGICAPNSITLTALGAPPTVNYLWNNGSSATAISVVTAGVYSVTVTDPANGCTKTAFEYALIHPKPDLSMLPIGCDSGCVYPVADTIHGPPGMASYNWQINGVTVSTMQNLGLNNIVMPVFGVPYTVSLIATTTNGCTDSTQFEYTPLNCGAPCFELMDTIWCNDDGTFSYQFKVVSYHGSSATAISLYNFNAPYLLNGSTMYSQPLFLPGYGSTSWLPAVPLTITPPYSPSLPPSFTYDVKLSFLDTMCTLSKSSLLPVCDPCAVNGVTVTISPPGPITACHGVPVTLTANVTGPGPYTYQWYKGNNVPIPGATDPTYTTTKKGVYHVTVSNGPCSDWSEGVVDIDRLPSPPAFIINQSGTNDLCVTSPIKLRGNGGTMSSYSYEWFKNGISTGVTTRNNSVSSTGSYTVKVTNIHGCTTESAPEVITNSCRLGSGADWTVELYPNPANQQVLISGYLGSNTPVTISIYTLLGQELMRLHTTTEQGRFHETIALPTHWSSGAYMVRIVTEHTMLTRQLTIE